MRLAADALIHPQAILFLDEPRMITKNQLLITLAREASNCTGLHETEIFNALLLRERLGSTGTGSGVAIPHARMRSLDHLCTIFARLRRPIDFHSGDEQPVDLVFLLLAPELAGADYLQVLSYASRLFRDQSVCRRLRGASNASALSSILSDHLAPAGDCHASPVPHSGPLPRL